MFPLWDDVIEPVIRAVGARRIVEIGALRGETTVRMLQRLGPDSELHVIDPLPQFDPAEHERRFPGQYHFHLGTSHDVLPGLPPADVALVDGDHNWYTVYHELRMLAETSAQAGAPLPVLVMHDVGWPYGRRDLYYAPERIPAEYRQPYERAGMRPGRSALVGNRGMNRDMDNADHEGGPRNGVMTALDDFVAEHDRPLRVVVVPIYYGLAIVAEHRVLDAHPELAALLDHIESADGQREVVALAERVRVDEAIFGQSWIRMLEEEVGRGADRYLELVKAMLLDAHDARQEVRVSYVLGLGGAAPDPAALRDPSRHLPLRWERLLNQRETGLVPDSEFGNLALTTMGRAQLDGLGAAALRVLAAGVPGDLLEVGVNGGGGSILLRATLAAREVADRRVWVADRFLATLPAPEPTDGTGAAVGGEQREGTAGDAGVDLPPAVRRLASDLNLVRDGFARFGLLDDQVRFLHGAPTDTLPHAPTGPLALVRLGEGSPDDTSRALEAVHGRLSPGAEVIVAGTANPAVEAAVARTRRTLGITAPLRQLDWNAVTWQHEESDAPVPSADDVGQADGSSPRPQATAGHPPIAPPAPDRAVALSVVVVFYNMRREAARTLRSLTRSYQREVGDLEYEVLVVDNGSDADQQLTGEYVASFGPEFRLLDTEGEPHPSPTVALNAGIAAARGEAFALMIDGAHVLTPGVLSNGMKALATYAPAVVATQQWYVGPGQQGDAQQAGYDQQVEDRLFRGIRWPTDGYRLFEIGHFIGERDWFDGIVESNCLFVPRKLLEQIGGFDESFSMPGGGYANLDLFERLALSPDVTPASILGEGTFHQFHGGTTTNVADDVVRRQRVVSYREHFEDLRGRPLTGLDKSIHFVGTMETKAARRTRARREVKLAFEAMRDSEAGDTSLPVPDEIRLAAIEAEWDHQTWQQATWLGHPVHRYPADLHVYQELVSAVRPRVVVVTGDDAGLGGRAAFLASVCDQIGSGQVVAVSTTPASDRPQHARITHIEGAPADAAIVAQVEAVAGGPPGAMVILGLDQVLGIIAAFESYAPLVPVGSYVVIENTVVRGRHVASDHGFGPYEAVDIILSRRGDFVSDSAGERYTLTFNRGGYLKRVAT
jgi:cephalosporin hydroxylase/glycosyltransferase involved in cell wall biosynthesis